jgi:cytochrome P450
MIALSLLYAVLVSTAVAAVGWFLLVIVFPLRYFFFPRKNQFPESYPFENTIRLSSNTHRILDFVLECVTKFQKLSNKKTFVWNIAFGLPHFVMTADVENITYILKTNFENFGKAGPGFKPFMQPLLGNGIFNADGHIWYAHRKTSALIFKLNRFKSSVSKVFNEDMDEVITWIRKQGGKVFDLQGLMHRYTLESIARIAFGFRFDVIHKERVQFADDFDYSTWYISKSMVDPLWFWKSLLTGHRAKFHAALHRTNKFAYNLIRERRAALESAPAEEKGMNDLLSLYIDKGTFEENDEAADTYLAPTDETLRDVMLNMVIAGRDTTAQALSWSFFRMCTEAGVQQKLRAEIVSILRQSGEIDALIGQKGEGHISYDTLAQMKYVEAFCMEVLRLHPSVPKEGKCCFKDDVLPDGTPVRKGDIVAFPPWTMGRDKELWGDDALEFKPERFLDKARPSPFVFIAFQAGPRTCLGQNFAIQEMKTCLARSLLVYEFALAQDPSTVTYEDSLTLPIRGGLKVTAQEII